MSIIRRDGTFVYNNNFPSSDFSFENSYIIDETTTEGKIITEKLLAGFLKPNAILDSFGEIVNVEFEDVTPVPITQQPTPEERIEQLRIEQAQSNAELFEMMLMLTGAVV